jgi:ketosteroid isomerase-like protein
MKPVMFIFLTIASIALGASPAARAESDRVARAEVEHFYADYERLLNTDEFLRDPAIVLPFFDEKNMRLFDAMEPEQLTGKDFSKHWIDITLAFPTKVTFLRMNIHADDKLAFVSYIQHFVGRQKNGPFFDMRTPTTDCLIKSDGKWRIVHQHASQPVDDATLAAVMVEKP